MNYIYTNWKKILLVILFCFLFFILFIELNDLFFGMVMALLLDHMIEALEDFGLNKYAGIFITLLLIIATVFILIFSLLPMIYKNLFNILKNFEISLTSEINPFEKTFFFKNINFKPWVEYIVNYFKSYNEDINLINNSGKILSTVSIIFSKFFNFIHIIFGFSGTILISRSLFSNVLYSYRSNDKVVKVLLFCRKKIKTLLLNMLIISLFNGLCFIFVLNFFAIKGAYSIGLLVFLGSFFVPSFGCLLGLISSIVIMTVQEYNLLSILINISLLLIPYSIENYFLIPKLICEELSINYLILLIGLLGTGKIFGSKYLIFTVPVIIIGEQVYKLMKTK
jgi:predicted PurR-regulated permease PerM